MRPFVHTGLGAQGALDFPLKVAAYGMRKQVELEANDRQDVAVNSPATLGSIAETVLIKGDLSDLTPEQRVFYYKTVCESVGVNPVTKPFDYIKTEQGLRLYPNKECAAQLRAKHNISLKIVSREINSQLFIVTAQASMPDGRSDESIGAVPLEKEEGEWKTVDGRRIFIPNGKYKPLPPEMRANQIMRGECVPLDSEILTRAGWRTYDQVTPGDEVLAYDCATDTCRWTALLDVTVHESAPVIRLYSQNFDVICTPDHSWAVQRRGIRLLVEAGNLAPSDRIVLAAPEGGITTSVLNRAETAVIGSLFSEAIGEILAADLEATYGPVFAERGIAIASPPREQTCTKIMQAFLQKAGFTEEQGPHCMPNLAARLAGNRKIMLQAMLLDEFGFAWANRDAIDTLEMLCALEGIGLKPERRQKRKRDRFRKTRYIAVISLQREDAGTMPVWCPTTAFGTWVMRQNGTVTITGNTKAKRRATLSLCGLGMFDPPEGADGEEVRWDFDTTAKPFPESSAQPVAPPAPPPPEPVDPELTAQLENFAQATREQRLAMFAQFKADLDKLMGDEGVAFYYDTLIQNGAHHAHELRSMNAAKRAFAAMWKRLREGVPVEGEQAQ